MTAPPAGDPYRPVPTLGPPPRRVPRSVELYVLLGFASLQCISIVVAFTSLSLHLALSKGPLKCEMVLFDVVPLLFLGVIVAYVLREERRAIELLRTGKVAAAKIVHEQKISDGKRWKWILTFEFEGEGGAPRRFVYTSNFPALVTDEPEEQVLYDPRSPDHVRLVDDLAGSPRVRPDGQIAPKSIVALAVVFLMPSVVVLSHLALLVRLIGS